MTRPMPRRNDSPAGLKVALASAAACALLLLASCTMVPTLTLSASSSWRTRRDRAAHTQAWSAGAQLGWSVARATTASSTQGDAGGADAPAPGAAEAASSARAPCAFESTCRWEHAARYAALGRAHSPPFEGDEP